MSRKCKKTFYFGFYPFKEHTHMLMSGSKNSSFHTPMPQREKFRLMAFLPTSFIKYLLRNYYVSGTVVGTEKQQQKKE